MKSYAVEVTAPHNPTLVQLEDPALYFPPPPKIMKMLRYNELKKKSGNIKASLTVVL
jgi:hypothetical protein